MTGKDYSSDGCVSWRKGDILRCMFEPVPMKEVNKDDYLLVVANPGIYTICYNLSTKRVVKDLYHLWTDDLFQLCVRLDDPPEDDYILYP